MSAPITLGPLAVQSGEFALPRSKSLSNRALIIQALLGEPSVEPFTEAEPEDVLTLHKLLRQIEDGATLDCGPAGTTFRFLTAYLITVEGTQILSGSARMLQRPIEPLVNALRQIGARIDYLGEAGFAPLSIGHISPSHSNSITIPGDVSSQFISALMLIGPSLDHGLRIEWTGSLVSRPYLDMTASLMRQYGAEIDIDDPHIEVHPAPYRKVNYHAEADWSAASYAAAWVALAEPGTQVVCKGLRQNSIQGDSGLVDWISAWGVSARFDESGLTFIRTEQVQPETFEADFNDCPDLAQTFSVLCAVTGVTGLFTGLQTLALKETDRIAALQAELQKVGVFLSKLPKRFSPAADVTYYMQEGMAEWEGEARFETYHDHRMAMALSLLSHRGRVQINDPEVVRKSFPKYWHSLAAITRASS